MGLKKIIKSIIADIDYALFEYGIRTEKIQVSSIDETIDELLESDKSLVRFGDGEITIIRGRNNATQTSAEGLSERLKEIITYDDDNLLITLPDIFRNLKEYRKASQKFWKDHILMSRSTYHKYCRAGKKYYNTSFSRNYYSYADRSNCERQNKRIRQIWAGRDVIVVEGAATHNGVGNNLLDMASGIQRIIGPSTNAYGRYEEILAACIEVADKFCESGNKENLIFLLSLGAAAKPLAFDLFQKGYRVIDIGNLDLEYEWFLMQTEGKTTLPKHSIIGDEANHEAGYDEYLSQIVRKIQ